VLTSSAVDRGYNLGSGNTKDYEIGICCFSAKKSLKISKGQSESLYQRTDNGQRKKYKRSNNDLQNIHINLKIE